MLGHSRLVCRSRATTCQYQMNNREKAKVKVVQHKSHSFLCLTISKPPIVMASQGQPLPLKVIEQVLNFIRGNLYNIECSWGKNSQQYTSALQLMNEWLDDNVAQLKVGQSDLDELMQKMSLNEPKS